MASPDLDALARVSRSIAVKSSFGSSWYCVRILLISSFAITGAVQCRAQDQSQAQDQTQVQTNDQTNQDVAEAARQERARKQNLQSKSKHVYTAEDLKRDQILTPEDRAQLEARKNQPAPPSLDSQKSAVGVEGSAVTQDTDSASPSANSESVPLGDVARRFRKQKQSQQLQRSAEFHLPFADAPVLASPKPPAQPLHPSAIVDPPAVVLPAPRVVAPYRPFVKRSPFERPRVLPSPTVASPRRLAPKAPAPRALPAPPSPSMRIAPSTPNSGKFTVVIVKPGDSLWKFAASRLGDGRRWQELLSLNPGLHDPSVIRAGTQIVLPVSVAPQRGPTKYVVRHGDTLWSIAQTQLGHCGSWSCISKANPDLQDPNVIHEGQVLLLPPSCPQ